MDRQTGFQNREAYRGGLLSIGNFDGVHRGHQRIISTLTAAARERGRPAVVMTFEPHPIRVLAPDRAPPQLSTLDRKAELLEQLGVDCLIAMPTDRALLDLSPEEFFSQVVRGEIDASGMVEGENFCFGRDRAGTVETLDRLCRESGISLTVVNHVSLGDLTVSSSAVRKAISEGRVAEAVAMLGHPYRVRGRVEPGAARGGAIGFPTANLSGVETLLPADGVYAGVAEVDGVRYAAAVHLGANPTFGETKRKLEVHLIDYSGGPLYDRELAVDLIDRVRGTLDFGDAAALQTQLRADIARVAGIVGEGEPE
ncbi:MAG: bifunctional riboflavin kinase/FAD synthetase [Planctomycetota bacterium]|nr:MAG: bifunctional riboflavin kinase/FAD synthetase [Planctomycetota bacterium]REK29234.1 MAG: bifunctional riboflavin kinase/FAD synthetase [Planctomycetota bacterium]REK29418.1 MAG: bifunctional riboflavin kinase/FAD synthetase [Planctomycetota bacterium]